MKISEVLVTHEHALSPPYTYLRIAAFFPDGEKPDIREPSVLDCSIHLPICFSVSGDLYLGNPIVQNLSLEPLYENYVVYW